MFVLNLFLVVLVVVVPEHHRLRYQPLVLVLVVLVLVLAELAGQTLDFALQLVDLAGGFVLYRNL